MNAGLNLNYSNRRKREGNGAICGGGEKSIKENNRVGRVIKCIGHSISFHQKIAMKTLNASWFIDGNKRLIDMVEKFYITTDQVQEVKTSTKSRVRVSSRWW